MGTHVLTHHNDNARTGANLNETLLRRNAVQSGRFGKLFDLDVIGSVYAQPLYVGGLLFGREPVDLAIIATMHNRVYAFRLDHPQAPLWVTQLSPAVPLPNPQIGDADYHDIEWEVGILSTPVIDLDSGVLFVVSIGLVKPDVIAHQIWKLDLRTGKVESGPVPFLMSGTGGPVFDSHLQNQRPGLLLDFDRVYVAFASYGDVGSYHGWVFSFDAVTLSQNGVFCTTRVGKSGGIWMSGEGPSSDGNGIYVSTGNGSFQVKMTGTTIDPVNSNFGDCYLKFSPDLRPADFFAPMNNAELNANDQDLGTTGLLLIPGTTLGIGGGKEGKLYLFDKSHLGGFNTTKDDVIQTFWAVPGTHDGVHNVHGSPLHFERPGKRWIYVWPEDSALRAFQFDPAINKFDPKPISETTITDPEGVPGGSKAMPGGFLSLSADGQEDGIVWANHPWTGNANQSIVPGVLRAFDAEDLTKELWNSRQVPDRDDFGNFAKFCPPTVADGRVLMATMGGLSRKNILDEAAREGPGLCNIDGKSLALAWAGTDGAGLLTDSGGRLNVASSADGLHFGSKTVIPDEATRHAPSLAWDPTSKTAFLAWTGLDKALNVMSSPDLATWSHKVVLRETSPYGPALVFGNGLLFLAWTGEDAALNVRASANGLVWDDFNKITLGETSDAAPALAFDSGTVRLLWAGIDHKLNYLESVNGLTWTGKVTVDLEKSPSAPALAFGPVGSAATLAWRGEDDKLNEIVSETGSIPFFNTPPTYKRIHRTDAAHAAPALAAFGGKMFIAWTGIDSDHKVNVAQLIRGAVAVYGMPLS